MKIYYLYILLLCMSEIVQPILSKRLFSFEKDPDLKKNVTELIMSKGYPVENHVVQTQDGYILQIQRIPFGRSGARMSKKQVVLIIHGLGGGAHDFVMNFPEQSLGFILADAGYDVWLGNARGNTYSRRHVTLTRDMPEFWDFSFDECAKYDVPDTIDYVLEKTGQEKLYYVGHSQGNTDAFAMLSESQEYNEKIKLVIALAPIAFLGHISGPIGFFGLLTTPLQFFANLLGIHEFLPSDGVMKYVSEYVCDTEIRAICDGFIFLNFGTDLKQLNTTRLGVYSAHTPAGTSTKSFVHYGQLVKSHKFAKFDYKSGNEHHYNQATPPEYDLTKITTPVALMWSENDKLGNPTDVSILRNQLKTVVIDYKVPYRAFNHLDFAIALNANKVVYSKVLELFKEFR